MRAEPTWITQRIVLAIQERLLAEHGGPPGLRDEGLLDAALAAPRNHFAYRQVDLFSLAAAYARAITQNHPFADGNKRVALTVAGVFLELNRFRLEASEQDAANATRALASKEIDVAQFAGWLRDCSSKVRTTRRRQTVKAPARKLKKR